MKRLLLSILGVLIFTTSFSQAVSIEKAKDLATKWLFLDEQKTSNDLECVYIQSNGERSYFYIFNSESDKTFIIVSADERILPILGYSNEGCFDVNNIPPNMELWLDGYKQEMDEIFSIKNIDKHPDWVKISNGGISKGTNAVGPLINLRWDQSPYYNQLTPGNCTTGCVATAMAMIMKYWNHPVHGYGSSAYNEVTYGILSANYEDEYYQWDQMPIQVTSPNLAVATLMYHCGVSVKMQYCISGLESGAYTSDVAIALKTYFGYQDECTFIEKEDYTATEWEDILRAQLDLGRPMQYSGNNASGTGGHSFILDGYTDDGKFHFNWGWSGSANGNFTLTNLNPGYNFNYLQGAVINIEPKWNLYCNEPLNIEGEIDGSTVTLNWEAPESSDLTLINYHIHRNNTKIGETTDKTYTDVNVGLGDYDYCVKAHYDDGCVSYEKVCVSLTSEYCSNPTDLEVVVKDSKVTLTWGKPENILASVKKYYVYRSGEKIAETASNRLKYDDKDVPDGIYDYCVSAFYGNDLESDGVCENVMVGEVGINDNYENNVKIYPNPAKDYVTIDAENITNVTIINNAGKTIKIISGSGNNSMNIDTRELSTGIYFIRINHGNEKTVVEKIIVE
ncbi:C10 family peptidase [Bacteroidales bacterium OttesenSCG-928-K03]|nr:C10 family peptidase [Bacteroidales bacterium OttesenSCG-928-L14]MDL2240335.1 C10 family peptidase [Bacteroidales bacterium OttesenSCG-928-K22]MDL2242488.1 C10 family peptidase [Bacteroidales bacterium OttesenSCG-928-K03]